MSDSVAAPLPYRWGRFQGWAILLSAALMTIVTLSADRLDSWEHFLNLVRPSVALLAGIGLLRKHRFGLLLYYLACTLYSFSGLGALVLSDASVLFLVAVILGFWLVPAVFYYPKR